MRPVAKYTTLLAALLVLLAVPAYASIPFAGFYPAQITVRGDLTLTSSEGQPIMALPINANFASLVPTIIPMGEHNGVGFHGSATGPDEEDFIRYDGLLTFRLPNDKQISFWVKFIVKKPQEEDVPAGTYCAKGFVSVEISSVFLPPEKITWVLMKGNVSEYTDAKDGKTSKALGHLMARAKIEGDEKWAKVNSVFSTDPPPTEETVEFSRTFYVVTLVSAKQVKLDGGLTITGTWNVHKRTVNVGRVDVGETTTTIALTQIAEGATGTLSAIFIQSKIPWQTEGAFNLAIETFGKINGDVVFFQTKSAPPLEPGIPLADFNKNGEVNILDLIEIGNAYKAKLGSPRYNLDFDIAPGGELESLGELDLEISILDLIAAAGELGQGY